MAEDWSIRLAVCGTKPGLEPHRYLHNYLCLNVNKQNKNELKRCVWYVYRKSNCVFVSLGSTLLTGSTSLQLWCNADGVKDEAEEQGKQTDLTMRDSHSAWRCIWQSK